MRHVVIFLLMGWGSLFRVEAQEVYDNCSNAYELCPNQTVSLSNIGANSTSCINCEDDFNYCFAPDNSIWCMFTTNAAGGTVQVDFSNLVFETNAGQDSELQAALIEAGTPCDAGSYTQVGSCHSNETGNFTLNAGALNPNTTYYLVIDGDNNGAGITSPAECTFDVTVSGVGIDRPTPTASITESSTSVCLNDIVSFTCNLSNCTDTSSFLWYINGVLSATTTDPVFLTSELHDGDVVSVETSCFPICSETVQATSQPISVYTISVDAGVDVWVAPGTTFALHGSTTAPVYYWTPSFLVSNPNVLDPIVSPTETTVYALTAEENGCTRTDYVTATILDEINVPNTFSPNGDNLNDTWIIEGIELYPDNMVSVYTRWGQKIFQTSAYSELKAWNGDNAPEGVYYYVVELNDDDSQVLRGTLTLLR